jgi:hypothetical protein
MPLMTCSPISGRRCFDVSGFSLSVFDLPVVRSIGSFSHTTRPQSFPPQSLIRTSDHDDFGSERSKIINVIDSGKLEHDVVRKPLRTFRHHALVSRSAEIHTPCGSAGNAVVVMQAIAPAETIAAAQVLNVINLFSVSDVSRRRVRMTVKKNSLREGDPAWRRRVVVSPL